MEEVAKKMKLTHVGNDRNSRDWSGLPTEILQLFYKGLTFADQIRFGSVCKSWLSSSSNKPHPPAPETPWLISNERSNHYPLLSISENRLYTIPDNSAKCLAFSFIAGSFKGWVVMETVDEFFILNLLSKLQIELPPQRTLPEFILSKGKEKVGMDYAKAFTMKTCSNANPTMIAFVTFGGDVALCKIGDTGWKGYRSIEKYSNLTFYNNKLYTVVRYGMKVDIFNIDDEMQLVPVGTIDCSLPLPVTILLPFQVYLVESEGNLLVVKRFCDRRLPDRRPTFSFLVLKLEDDDDGRQPRFVMVNSLNDQALFLSDTSSESLSAKDCPGFLGSHIYFTGASNYGNSPDMGVFSIEDRTMARMLLPPNFCSSLWVVPRFATECNCNCALRKTDHA